MIDQAIARVKDQITALKHVGGDADFQTAVESNPKITPCAFVFEVAETPAPCGDVPMVIQRVSAQFAVVYCVRNVSDASGGAARTTMRTLRRAGIAALLGWVPEAGYDAIERGASRLLMFRDGHMWWQDLFSTGYYDKEA